MDVAARLVPTRLPDDPVAQVLVLHGGGARRHGMRVSPTQLSVLRMIPIAKRIAHAGGGRIAVVRVLNSVRGWDTTHTPVRDVRWALGRMRESTGRALPTCLVGHSLGGRAAILAADHAQVRSVVALAPWLQPSDGAIDLDGRPVMVVHGTEDRIASPARAVAASEALARTAMVGFVSIDGGRHAMLRHHGQFDAYAADFARATLLDEPARFDPVARVIDGARWVDA